MHNCLINTRGLCQQHQLCKCSDCSVLPDGIVSLRCAIMCINLGAAVWWQFRRSVIYHFLSVKHNKIINKWAIVDNNLCNNCKIYSQKIKYVLIYLLYSYLPSHLFHLSFHRNVLKWALVLLGKTCFLKDYPQIIW